MNEPALGFSVVVPLFNEEESVGALHEEITRAARGTGRSYEVIYVDDGSRDATFERLREIAAADPHVKVVRFRRNYGQTAAIQAGFDQVQGEVVITMDGDLQNDPADFGLLLGLSDKGYDVVSGWRRDRKDKLVSRRLPSMAANWMIGRLTGMRIHDNGCTLKAYRREVVKRASLYAEMHRFLAPMMTLSGCTYREVVVNHRARRYGQSKYGISRIWKVFLDLVTVKMLLGFATRPSAWFGLLSLPFLAGTLLALAVSVYSYATLIPGMAYPLVFPSATVLFAVAFAHLNLLGMFAELTVKVGDFRENEAVLSRLDRGGLEP